MRACVCARVCVLDGTLIRACNQSLTYTRKKHQIGKR